MLPQRQSITSRQCSHGNLQTCHGRHFGCGVDCVLIQQHVKGDSKTALDLAEVVPKCSGVKNSAKDLSLTLSLLRKAQCGLNLAKAKHITWFQTNQFRNTSKHLKSRTWNICDELTKRTRVSEDSEGTANAVRSKWYLVPLRANA